MDNLLHELTQWDNDVFLFLNSLGSTPWDSFWETISKKYVWVPLYLALLIAVYSKLGNWKAFLVFCLFVAALITIVDQSITEFFKPQIARLRPCHFEPIGSIYMVNSECGGLYGFMSSHAANTFAIATLVGCFFRSNRWVCIGLLTWASIVGYSRIYLGLHYPLDVIAGAIWGGLWGVLSYKLFQSVLSRFSGQLIGP